MGISPGWHACPEGCLFLSAWFHVCWHLHTHPASPSWSLNGLGAKNVALRPKLCVMLGQFGTSSLPGNSRREIRRSKKVHDPLNLYKHKPPKMEKMYPTPSECGDRKMEQASTGHPAHLRAGWSPCFFFLSKQLGLWCWKWFHSFISFEDTQLSLMWICFMEIPTAAGWLSWVTFILGEQEPSCSPTHWRADQAGIPQTPGFFPL